MLLQMVNAAEGLAFEHALFQSTGSQVGVWASEGRSVVCPRRFERLPRFAAATAQLAEMGFPVHLRPTGGGAVPQGPGCVNLALAFDASERFTIEDGYRLLTQIVTKALGGLGAKLKTGDTSGSFCDGAWNLSLEDQKLVGTAQRIRPLPGGRKRMLAHAVILTEETYLPGAEAIAQFHLALGLTPIRAEAHISLAACGIATFPADAMLNTAKRALAELGAPENIADITKKGGNHVQPNHPHPS